MTNSYENSELKRDPFELIKDYPKIMEDNESIRQVSWMYEWILLSKRNIQNQLRIPQVSYVRVFVTIFVSAICCLLYYGVGQDKAGVQDRNGALFFITLNAGFSALSNVSQIFPQERPVFLREVNSGMYRVSSYFSSKIMTEFVPSAILVLFQSCIIYYIIGFNDATPQHFFRYVLIMICMVNQMSGVGYMLGAAFADK